jgi:Zn finger protein HypA/HybF involved in hydrogenase expression
MPNIPLPTVSQIFELVKKGATLEAQEKIVELRQAVVDCQDDNLRLRADIQNLQGQIAELTQKLSLREAVEFDHANGVYWPKGEEKGDHPICPTCYDNASKPIRMHTTYSRPTQFDGGHYIWVCTVCSIKIVRNDKPTEPALPPRQDRFHGPFHWPERG